MLKKLTSSLCFSVVLWCFSIGGVAQTETKDSLARELFRTTSSGFKNSALHSSRIRDRIFAHLKFSESQQEEMLAIDEDIKRKIDQLKSKPVEWDVSDVNSSPLEERDQQIFELEKSKLQRAESILLPFQREKLFQVSNHLNLGKGVLFGQYNRNALLDDMVDISMSERTKLDQAISDSRKEFNEELTELWLKYHKQIRASTPAAESGLGDLLGDPAPIRLKLK